MEQKYWDKFCATGDVYDYLGYKMEVYTHINGKERAQAETKTEAGNGCTIRKTCPCTAKRHCGGEECV